MIFSWKFRLVGKHVHVQLVNGIAGAGRPQIVCSCRQAEAVIWVTAYGPSRQGATGRTERRHTETIIDPSVHRHMAFGGASLSNSFAGRINGLQRIRGNGFASKLAARRGYVRTSVVPTGLESSFHLTPR